MIWVKSRFMLNLIKFYSELFLRAIYKRLRGIDSYYTRYYRDYSRKELFEERHCKEVLRTVMHIIKRLSGITIIFIDVGSYLGEYVKELASYTTLSVAIEPYPDNYIKLCSIIADLGFKRVLVLKYAIYDRNATVFSMFAKILLTVSYEDRELRESLR